MFVLMFEIDYEGQSVLGVYASLRDAVAAADRLRDDRDLVVYRYEVGAAADFDSGVCVWAASEGRQTVVEE
jgi:hypothetical protein